MGSGALADDSGQVLSEFIEIIPTVSTPGQVDVN